MAQYEPIYMDRHRGSLNLTLIVAVVVAVLGIVNSRVELIVVGVGFAAWAWLTTPNTYMLFGDRLVIAYGRPRLRHILYSQIDNVQMVALAFWGPRLRVQPRNGRGAWLTPRDAETFHARFNEALGQFRGYSPEEELPPPE